MLLDIASNNDISDNVGIRQKVTLDPGITGHIRILMAEDNRINAEIAKEMLERLGCEVVTAPNGRNACEILKTDRNFDLIFMDCQMPVMDGFETTGKIIEFENINNQKHIPIIALTPNPIWTARMFRPSLALSKASSSPMKNIATSRVLCV
jgi:CheY-like chemotaxis protein